MSPDRLIPYFIAFLAIALISNWALGMQIGLGLCLCAGTECLLRLRKVDCGRFQ